MGKKFLEVFPDLHMTAEMEELLKLVEIERVSVSKNRSSIRVYIISPRLIHKKNLYDLEKGIRDQLFPGKQLEIKIMERYRLSGQYTPEKLLNVYKDSILLELKNYLERAICCFHQWEHLHLYVYKDVLFPMKR